MTTSIARRGFGLAALATCLALAAFTALTPVPALAAASQITPQQTTQTGWTQIDIWQKGISPSSPYSGDSRTANINIYVKNAEGEFVPKEISVDMPNGTSFNDMITALGEQLNDCLEAGYQFNWQSHSNGMTIWPTDAGADPDSEGNPTDYPDDEKNSAILRKETHPVKK